MEIGTIGAGEFAQAFAKRVIKAGYEVKLSNSRGPESLREIVMQLGRGETATTREEAVACEMVLLAVPWDNVPETLASLPKWKNQILIDGTNPFHGQAGNFTPAAVGNLSTSQFVSADDDGAKKRVETLLKAFGYSVVDLGNLRDGGLIQQAGGPLAGRDFLERGES